MSQPSKRQKTQPTYDLLYWPGFPGRGEPIRLLLEATSTPYTDIANTTPDGINEVLSLISPDSTHTPPVCAPPFLRVPGAGPDGVPLIISQTPNILLYLSEKVGLVPEGDDAAKYAVHALALTALDVNNEAHDTHHPVSVAAYYEEQKPEALKKAKDFREKRIPKFLGYFERVLKANEEGKGRYLVGEGLTYADTTLWQVVDGLRYAFPKEMEAREKEFPGVLGSFYEGVKGEERIKEYLGSKRRQPYGDGIYRYYPELDRQEE